MVEDQGWAFGGKIGHFPFFDLRNTSFLDFFDLRSKTFLQIPSLKQWPSTVLLRWHCWLWMYGDG